MLLFGRSGFTGAAHAARMGNRVCGGKGGCLTDTPAGKSFKLLIVGDQGSGKTSVVRRYTSNQFSSEHTEQQLPFLTSHTLRLSGIGVGGGRDEGQVSMVFYDVPTNVRGFTKGDYYKKADAVIVVVDVLDPDCMESASVWKQDILDHTDNNGNVPFLVLVNKMDQLTNGIEQILQEFAKTAEEGGFAACLAVSCQDGSGEVHAALNALLRLLVEREHPTPPYPFTQDNPCPEERRRKIKLPFPTIGIQEYDELLDICWREIQEVNSYRALLETGLSDISHACRAGHLLTELPSSSSLSIEHCIAAVRSRLSGRQSSTVDSSSGFPQLLVSDKALYQGGPEVVKVVQLYQDKVYPPGFSLVVNLPSTLRLLSSCWEDLGTITERQVPWETEILGEASTGGASDHEGPRSGEERQPLGTNRQRRMDFRKVAQIRSAVATWMEVVMTTSRYVEALSLRIYAAAVWDTNT